MKKILTKEILKFILVFLIGLFTYWVGVYTASPWLFGWLGGILSIVLVEKL